MKACLCCAFQVPQHTTVSVSITELLFLALPVLTVRGDHCVGD